MLARYSNTTTIFLSEHLKTKDIPVAVAFWVGLEECLSVWKCSIHSTP